MLDHLNLLLFLLPLYLLERSHCLIKPHLDQTGCPQYLDTLRESIKREELRRSELMDQMTKLEASLSDMRTQGREQFKNIMERVRRFQLQSYDIQDQFNHTSW